MKGFDFKRFKNVLNYDFTTGLSPMMWFSLGMVILYLLIFGLFFNLNYNMKASNIPPEMNDFLMKTTIHEVASASFFAAYLFMLGAACTLFRDVQKKAPRTIFLMLPATNAEKFVSRWIYLLVFSLIGGIGSFVVADLLHTAWQGISGNPMVLATGYFFDRIPHEATARTYDIVSFYAFFLTLHSFCLMCSVLFKKYHLVATFAVGLTLWELLNQSLRLVLSQEIKEPVLLVLMFVCIILFTTLAYRLFCRWQVVTHKFLNL